MGFLVKVFLLYTSCVHSHGGQSELQNSDSGFSLVLTDCLVRWMLEKIFLLLIAALAVLLQ